MDEPASQQYRAAAQQRHTAGELILWWLGQILPTRQLVSLDNLGQRRRSDTNKGSRLKCYQANNNIDCVSSAGKQIDMDMSSAQSDMANERLIDELIDNWVIGLVKGIYTNSDSIYSTGTMKIYSIKISNLVKDREI